MCESPRNVFIAYSKICICGYELLISTQNFTLEISLTWKTIVSVLFFLWKYKVFRLFFTSPVCLSLSLSLSLEDKHPICVSLCGFQLDVSFVLPQQRAFDHSEIDSAYYRTCISSVC